jgi:hypothetical protein
MSDEVAACQVCHGTGVACLECDREGLEPYRVQIFRASPDGKHYGTSYYS